MRHAQHVAHEAEAAGFLEQGAHGFDQRGQLLGLAGGKQTYVGEDAGKIVIGADAAIPAATDAVKDRVVETELFDEPLEFRQFGSAKYDLNFFEGLHGAGNQGPRTAVTAAS